MSARKCWKCSLLGVIFATGVSSFREMASAGQAKPTYTLSLLHNRIYVTVAENSDDRSEPAESYGFHFCNLASEFLLQSRHVRSTSAFAGGPTLTRADHRVSYRRPIRNRQPQSSARWHCPDMHRSHCGHCGNLRF